MLINIQSLSGFLKINVTTCKAEMPTDNMSKNEYLKKVVNEKVLLSHHKLHHRVK